MARGAALLALAAAAALADEGVAAQLGLRLHQAFAEGGVILELPFGLRADRRAQAGVGRRQTRQQTLVRRRTGPRHGRAYGTGTAQARGVSVLTLAAGQRRLQGALGVLVGVEKSRLGRWFQRHGPVHVVIVGPNESYLAERQHWDLLEVQTVQLHPQGTSRFHLGDPGRAAPGVGAGCSRLSGHIRQTCKHKRTTLAMHPCSLPGSAGMGVALESAADA